MTLHVSVENKIRILHLLVLTALLRNEQGIEVIQGSLFFFVHTHRQTDTHHTCDLTEILSFLFQSLSYEVHTDSEGLKLA